MFWKLILRGPILRSGLKKAVELAESNRAYWSDPDRVGADF